MALSPSIEDREYQKFDLNGSGETAVRTITEGTLTGNIQPSGLQNAGLVTEVVIDDTNWTPLPATALTDRNAIVVQNLSGKEIKINYSSSVPGYVGVVVSDGSERAYDIKDSIVLYGKVAPGLGNAVINIEELS
jgi:hypothetical protein